MRKSFFEFLMLKEGAGSDGAAKGISSEVKLSDDSDYKPFVADEEHHPNLAVIVKAFIDSGKVSFPGPDGYPQKLTTLDPSKGETTPKLKKKTLYLVGGAVRDHLLGKTPKNYDLATDATPDEIRLILRNAGFTEVKPSADKGGPVDKKYERHPEAGSKNRVYYAKGWDRAGREYTMGARVNGEEFEIATFRKDSKGSGGKTPDRMEFSGLEDDAARRDFTINSMYIPLTTDGPNSKLIDPHGGAHHLRSGDVRFVGNPKDRLEEDQLRALRYIRFVSRFNSHDSVPPEYKDAISEIKDLPSVSREKIREEFLKGLEHPDVDPRKYIKLYKEFGILQTVFPGMSFKLDKSEDYIDKKDKRLAVAWILRANNPQDVRDMFSKLKAGWSNSEINDIVHLIEMLGWASKRHKDEDGFFGGFYKMKQGLNNTSLVPSLLRQWGKLNGMDDDIMGNFIQHDLSTRGYVNDGQGSRTVNPLLRNLYGRPPEGEEFGQGIQHIEGENFRKRFQKNKRKEEN